MPDLSYRHADSNDLPFIVRLIHEDDVSGNNVDDPSEPLDPAYGQALAQITADPNQALYIAELAGERIGTFQLTFTPGIARRGLKRSTIEAVHVAPAHRNRGYGRTMIRWAIEQSRANGCGMVQLTSNKKRLDAHRFYLTLGFSQSHEGFKLML